MNNNPPYINHLFSVEVQSADRTAKGNNIARSVPCAATAIFPRDTDEIRIKISGCLTAADITEAKRVIEGHGRILSSQTL